MPIYEYLCESCRSEFELLVASSAAKVACPTCKSKKVSKKFSAFAAHQGSSGAPCGQAKCPSASAGSCASGQCPFA